MDKELEKKIDKNFIETLQHDKEAMQTSGSSGTSPSNKEKCAFCNKEGKEKAMLGYWVCGENHNATPAQVGTSPQPEEWA